MTPEILVRFALVLLRLVIVPAVPVILVIVPEVLFSVAIVPIPLTFNCIVLVIPSIDVSETVSVESVAPTILTLARVVIPTTLSAPEISTELLIST